MWVPVVADDDDDVDDNVQPFTDKEANTEVVTYPRSHMQQKQHENSDTLTSNTMLFLLQWVKNLIFLLKEETILVLWPVEALQKTNNIITIME